MSLYGYKKKHKPALWLTSFAPKRPATASEPQRPPQRRVKPLKRRSKAMESKLRAYSKLRAAYLLKCPWCMVCLVKFATQVHHKKKRGRYLLDESMWLPVCFWCHTEIENHPQWAFDHGYSIRIAGEKKWLKNTC